MQNGFISPVVVTLGLLALGLAVATYSLAQWHWRSAQAYVKSVSLLYTAQSAQELAWDELKKVPVQNIPRRQVKEMTLPQGLTEEDVIVNWDLTYYPTIPQGYLQTNVLSQNPAMQQSAGRIFRLGTDTTTGRPQVVHYYYRE